MKLLTAITEYLAWRKTQGFATNTIRNDKAGLKFIPEVLGDAELAKIQYADMERVLDLLVARRAPSSVNACLSTFQAFFKWARAMKHIPPDHDPLLGFRYRKVPAVHRTRLSLPEFPALLDAAPEPRLRMLTALGLFLFLRASEITSLTIRDVDLAEGTISVVVHKTGDHDIMPIPKELDAELRLWYQAYADEVGELKPDYYLIPARTQRGFGTHKLAPMNRVSRPQELIKRVFSAYGMPNRKGEACHTLRRSGARALFDELSGNGIDGALEVVQTQLHHASVVMTERYLGVTHSRAKRDNMLRGETMFPSLAADNVVQLRRVENG